MAVTKIVSIEITDDLTKLCYTSYNQKRTTVYKTMKFYNPEDSVEDSVIIDPAKYGMELQRQLKKGDIKCKNVVFIISSNRVLSREVKIPDMKEKLIEDYIEGEKEEYFPMDISNTKITYNILDRDKESKEIRLIVYAVPIELIQSYHTLADGVNLNVVAIDSTGNATFQYLKREVPGKIDFYFQINENNSMFTILEDGKFAIQRNMNFGAESIAGKLMEEVPYGEMDFDQAMLRLENEELLYKSFDEMYNYSPATGTDAERHERKKRITEEVRPLIAGFTRVLEYYNSKNKEAVINNVYIGGCGSRINNIDKLFMSEFNGINIIVINDLPGLKYFKSDLPMAKNSTEFIACIGAANFTLDFSGVEDKSSSSTPVAFIVIVFIMTILAVAAIIGVPLLNYKLSLDEQEDLRAEKAQYQYMQEVKDTLDTKQANLTELQAFALTTVTANEYWNNILEQFEVNLPSNTIVSSVTSTDLGVTMVISIPTKYEVSKLIMQLKKIPVFANISVAGVNEVKDDETGIVKEEFTVSCEYPVPEPTEEPAAESSEESSEEASE